MTTSHFDVKIFDTYLKTKWLGRQFIYKDVTETTMDDARFSARSGSPSGTTILAEVQTNARGSKNHKWNALNKGNLYVSFIIHREIQQEEFVDKFDVEVSAALSVLGVLRELGLKDVNLKWPNDIWIRGHKLAGFLAENSGIKQGPSESIYILGIGLNVNADVRRNPDLHAIATSIRCERDGEFINREKLLADICNNLEEILEWKRDKLYEESMKNQLFNSGSTVRVSHLSGGKTSLGTIERIQDNWDIMFKDEADKVWQGTSQHFSIRPYPRKTVYVYNGIMTAPWSATLLIKTFSALVDLCCLSVSSLNDAKLRDGSWKENAALLVLGEMDHHKHTDRDLTDFLSHVQNYVDNGGRVFVCGSGADLLYSHIFKSSDPAITMEDLVVGAKGHQEMSSVSVNLKSSGETFLGLYVNNKYMFSTGNLQNCDIFGYYGQAMDKVSDAAALVVHHGKGHIGLIGFNVEITYADIDEVTSHLIGNNANDIEALETTVFQRDILVKSMIEHY